MNSIEVISFLNPICLSRQTNVLQHVAKELSESSRAHTLNQGFGPVTSIREMSALPSPTPISEAGEVHLQAKGRR